MSDETRLESLLATFRRRALGDEALRWSLRAVIGVSAWAMVALIASRLRPIPWARQLWEVGAAALVLGAGIGWARSRPDLMTAARAADARLALAERLASALAFAGSPGDLPAKLRQDAVARAEGRRPAEAFPVRRHRPSALVAGASAVAVAGLALLPNPMDPVLARRRADQATLKTITSQIRKQEEAARAAAGDHPTAEQKALDDALGQALKKLEAASSPHRALEALGTLNERLQALDDPTIAGKIAGAASAGGALGAGPGGQALGASLSSSDLPAAADQARALARALSGLTADQRSQLARALQSAAGAAEGSTLGGALSQAAGALAAGDVPGARQALGKAAGAISGLSSHQAQEQALGRAESAVQQAQQEAAGQAAGAGSQGQAAAGQGEAGQAAGARGQGQGTGRGQGSGAGGGTGGTGGGGGTGGTGTGGGAHEAGKPSDRVYVPGNGSAPGAQALPPGPLGPGRQVPQTGYQSVLGSYSRAELNALNQTVLPPSERELVQQYFAGLAGAGP